MKTSVEKSHLHLAQNVKDEKFQMVAKEMSKLTEICCNMVIGVLPFEQIWK